MDKLLKKVIESLEAVKSAKIEKLDGIKLVFEDSWSLVRFSGTEPKIRITVEAKTKKRANEIYDKVHRAVKRGIKKAG
ncbi:MAG: hypothetical protein KAI64_03605 [Thermoplasmata archaeon]|nr:hypothetical protein [Thermoplasmata archaeon]